MNFFLPKINSQMMSVEADPNRSLPNVGGESTGEENLFSMLMDSITGDSSDSELETIESALKQNSKLDSVSDTVSQKDLIAKLVDGKNLLEGQESIFEKSVLNEGEESKLEGSKLSENSKLINILTKTQDDLNFLRGQKQSEGNPKIENSIFNKALGLENNNKKQIQKPTSSIIENTKSVSHIGDNAPIPVELKMRSMLAKSNGIKNYKAQEGLQENSLVKNSFEPQVDQILAEKPETIHTSSLSKNMLGVENKIDSLSFSKSAAPTLNLSELNLSSASDSEVLNQITNHLDKFRLANTKDLSVLVKHNELGQFQLNANEVRVGDKGQLNLEILSQSKEVQSFFKANEGGLMSVLAEKGFSVGSFKVSQSNASEDLSKESNLSDSNKNFGGDQQKESRQQDSQRRARLWKDYQEKLGA